MKNTVEEYVVALTTGEKIKIIEGYEQLQTDGFIGDEPIRIHAEKLMEILGSNTQVVWWMNQLAFEAYRYFGQIVIEDIVWRWEQDGDPVISV